MKRDKTQHKIFPPPMTDDNKTLDFNQEANNSHHEQCCASQYYIQGDHTNEDMN